MNRTMKTTPTVKTLIADALSRTKALELEGQKVQREGAKIVEDAQAERAKLEEALRMAGDKIRGTRDVTEQAEAVHTARLDHRVESTLRATTTPVTLVQLAKQLREPAARVQRVLKRLRETPCPTRSAHTPDAKMIHNHGTADDPRWSWVLGDEVDAPTLYAAVEAMLRRRPYTFAELSAATGARRGRISGATVQFAREEAPIYTVGGNDRKYLWYIGDLSKLPAAQRKSARRVRLDPDKNKS